MDGNADAIEEVFAYFREHRRRLHAPMTEYAETLIRRKLERIEREHGHDPVEVLQQSIEEGWKGVFPLRESGRMNGKPLKDYADRSLLNIAHELGIGTVGRTRDQLIDAIKVKGGGR